MNKDTIRIEKLKVIELFAGIGAWAKAFEKLGIEHEVVAAVEFDKKTIQSYNLIHNTNFEQTDITKLDTIDLPECDVICYSPPCQAFSVAGRQEGFEDARGTLFFEALRVIQAKKPKYAIMENVKGLISKKFEFEFGVMLDLLEQEGYKNYWKVLNAKDYGIPQNRERVFIVSIRNDVDKEFQFGNGFDNDLRLKDLLEEEVEERFYISQDKTDKLLQELKNKNLQYGEVRPCLTPERVNKRQNGRRFKEDGEPSFTVNTQDRHGILKVGNVNPSGKGMNGAVYSEEGLSPTVTTNKGEGHKILQVGMLDIKGSEQIRRVYDPEGISPTLNTMQGGNRQPKIIEENTLKFVGGIKTGEMWLEDGKSLSRNFPQGNRVYDESGIAVSQTSQGGGLGGKTGLYLEKQCRIRKLTPKECLRLMGFEDEDYKILHNNKVSNSQIYKMAGNSIVVDTLINGIFRNLFSTYISNDLKN